MAEVIVPKSENELSQIIANAYGAKTSLEIIGHGTKAALGHQVNADVVVDLSSLSGITMYEPEELVMSAHAGTPISEINSALGAKGQMLAFEPMDMAHVYGLKPGGGTIGGLFMGGFGGPRRLSAGAPRDHLLGINAVNGSGEIFKSGGRVVKNVSGFDIPKLMAGSFGTLAVASSLTFKVLPRPQAVRTVALYGLGLDQAGQAMRTVLSSPHEVSGAAYIPASICKNSEIDEIKSSGQSVVVIRVEGPRPSVTYRAQAIIAMLSSFGPGLELGSEKSIHLWHEIRDVHHLGNDRAKHLWRVSVAPSDGPRLGKWIDENIVADYFMDWSGGLVWIAIENANSEISQKLRDVISGFGGHGTLVRAENDDRDLIGVFNPASDSLGPLIERVKQSFDPGGILNPGKMGFSK